MIQFPPVQQANEDGLLAIGGNLELNTLVEAYTNGIFPWPIDQNFPVTWFAPDPRGVIYVDKLNISKSMKRFLNNTDYYVKFNTQFSHVIWECAQIKNRKEKGTWITDEIMSAYDTLFQNKLAYSVEAYSGNELIGGLYGVCIGNFVSGESMFFRKENASKFALIKLIQRLKEKNVQWLDTQQTTPVVASLGGEEIPRKLFMEQLGHCNFDLPRDYLFPGN